MRCGKLLYGEHFSACLCGGHALSALSVSLSVTGHPLLSPLVIRFTCIYTSVHVDRYTRRVCVCVCGVRDRSPFPCLRMTPRTRGARHLATTFMLIDLCPLDTLWSLPRPKFCSCFRCIHTFMHTVTTVPFLHSFSTRLPPTSTHIDASNSFLPRALALSPSPLVISYWRVPFQPYRTHFLHFITPYITLYTQFKQHFCAGPSSVHPIPSFPSLLQRVLSLPSHIANSNSNSPPSQTCPPLSNQQHTRWRLFFVQVNLQNVCRPFQFSLRHVRPSSQTTFIIHSFASSISNATFTHPSTCRIIIRPVSIFCSFHPYKLAAFIAQSTPS